MSKNIKKLSLKSYKKLGHIPMSKKPSKKQLRSLYEQKKFSITQIATLLNVGRTTIARYLNKYGIETRSSKEGLKLILLKDGKCGGYLQKKLNKKQKQFILGTLLGDGSLYLGKRNKQARLKIQQSGKDMDYIRYKKELLRDFVTGKINKDTHRNKKVNKTYHSYYFITITHPEFTQFFNQFYKNHKKILTKDTLKQLTPFGLAVWIMDDGHYNKKGKFMDIYSMNFTDKENQIIIEWFSEKLEIEPKINFHKQSNKFYLRFNQEDTRNLIKIIKPYIIKSMDRKIK